MLLYTFPTRGQVPSVGKLASLQFGQFLLGSFAFEKWKKRELAVRRSIICPFAFSLGRVKVVWFYKILPVFLSM
jgi:hypothetical protein